MTIENAPRSVQMTYSAGDIAALNLMIWRFWLVLIGSVATIVTIIPIVLSLLGGYSMKGAIRTVDWQFTGWMLLTFVGWILILTVAAYWLRKRKGFFGPITLSLNGDGLAYRNRQMSGTVFWPAIKSIKCSSGRIFLFISARSAFIIPRRAFETDSQFETFLDRARALRNATEIDQPRNLAKSVTVE